MSEPRSAAESRAARLLLPPLASALSGPNRPAGQPPQPQGVLGDHVEAAPAPAPSSSSVRRSEVTPPRRLTAYLPVAVPIDPSTVPAATPVLAGEDHNSDAAEEIESSPAESATKPSLQQGARQRRRRLMIAAVLLALVVALVVGLSVGLTVPSASSPERPTEDPSQPSPTLSPTPLFDCSRAYGAFNVCVGYDGTGTSDCESCIARYYSGFLRLNLSDVFKILCPEIDDETCDAIASCSDSCSGCTQEFVAYFECRSNCSLAGTGCSGDPTPAPN